MENQKSNSSLKAIILVLALLLVASLFYIYQLTSQTTELTTQVTEVKSEKENILKELGDLKAIYDAAIAENTTMSDELIAERDKIVNLMEQLKKSKGDVASLAKYKTQFVALQAKMNTLMQEVEGLKVQNKKLTTHIDSTEVVLEEAKNYNKTLVGQNEELSKTVEKAAKLSVLNLKTMAYKKRNSGKEIETDKASRANTLRVSFTIAENSVAKSGDKNYYVQIIDSKNNV